MKGTLRFVVTLRRSSVIVGLRSQSLRARSCRAVSWPGKGRDGAGAGKRRSGHGAGLIISGKGTRRGRKIEVGWLVCLRPLQFGGARESSTFRAPLTDVLPGAALLLPPHRSASSMGLRPLPFGRSNRRRFARPSRRSSQVLLCCFLHTGRRALLGLRPLHFRGALESSTFRAPLTEAMASLGIGLG